MPNAQPVAGTAVSQERLHAMADEIATLHDRIARAIAELNTAPDPAGEVASKREASAIKAANQRAWVILSEGRDPPSQRRPEDAGQP